MSPREPVMPVVHRRAPRPTPRALHSAGGGGRGRYLWTHGHNRRLVSRDLFLGSGSLRRSRSRGHKALSNWRNRHNQISASHSYDLGIRESSKRGFSPLKPSRRWTRRLHSVAGSEA